MPTAHRYRTNPTMANIAVHCTSSKLQKLTWSTVSSCDRQMENVYEAETQPLTKRKGGCGGNLMLISTLFSADGK